MYKFDEQALRKGINWGLGSQGIWTPELEDIMFNEITNAALRIHDVVGQSEQLKVFLSTMIEEFDNGEVSWETRDSAESFLKNL